MIPVPRHERVVLLALGGLVLGVGVARARGHGYLGGLKTAPPVVVAEAPVRLISDTLRSSETVSQLFARRGVSDVNWPALARAVRNFNPDRLKSGLVFTFQQRHGAPAPHAVVVRVSYDARLWMRRADSGWTAELERIPWRVDPVVVAGAIHNTLYEAMDAAVGEEVLPQDARNQLVWGLSEVYDWVVDFSRDIQEGDRFRVLAERMVSLEGEVRYGRILAARLDVGSRPLRAFRFDEGERAEFYDDQGRSMKRELLRSPLEFKRIGSGFSRSRFHPILRYRRPHLGIDFGAAYGAPVRSVGTGTVTFAGRMGGYGNLVEVRHNARTSTRYAHLSNFAARVHVGAPVVQGETIGYVGASGLATSPHLHYELRINGKAVNPRRQFDTSSGVPVPAARREAFEQEKRRLTGLLEPETLATARSAT